MYPSLGLGAFFFFSFFFLGFGFSDYDCFPEDLTDLSRSDMLLDLVIRPPATGYSVFLDFDLEAFTSTFAGSAFGLRGALPFLSLSC